MGSRHKYSKNKIAKIYRENILPNFTQNLPLSVKECYNAVSMDFCMAVLLRTSLSKSSIEQSRRLEREDLEDTLDWISYDIGYEGKSFPTAHLIRKTLISWPQKDIVKRHRIIMSRQIKKLKKSEWFKNSHQKEGVVIAFDVTEKGYFGSGDDYTVFSKGRTVAKRCHAYLSMQIVCPGFRLILDVEPVFKDKKPLSKLMKLMLARVAKHGLKFKKIYLDRGFYQIEVLKELKKGGYADRSLMPAIRTSRVKEAIEAWHLENGFKAGMLEMRLGEGKNAEDYILLFSPLKVEKRKSIRKKKKGKAKIWDFYLFFCLLKPPEISSFSDIELVFNRLSWDYRNRWGIETGYRVVKTIWANTTSLDYTLRLWLMWNAITIYNLWVLENLALLEAKGIPASYNCCKGNSLTKPRVKKIPREPHERPKRPWFPRSLQPMVTFLRVLEFISRDEILNLMTTGYKPPPEVKINKEIKN